jgi:hypothetical protein
MQLMEAICFVSNLGNEAPAAVLQPTVGVGKFSVVVSYSGYPIISSNEPIFHHTFSRH